MSTFWFSRNNLTRTVSNILSLFSAVDSDMTTFESSLSDLDDDMDDIRNVFLNGNVSILVVDDTLYDSSNNAVLDSGASSVKASIVYHKQT